MRLDYRAVVHRFVFGWVGMFLRYEILKLIEKYDVITYRSVSVQLSEMLLGIRVKYRSPLNRVEVDHDRRQLNSKLLPLFLKPSMYSFFSAHLFCAYVFYFRIMVALSATVWYTCPMWQVWIILMASALAQLVSCLVTCPVEAVRIRVMTCDKRPEFLSFVGTAKEMLDEEGLAYFWSGLGALLFRELPFAIAKVSR